MITGIDALLAKYARQFPHNSNGGGTITVQLIKGPSSSSVDPIAARRAAALHAKRMVASSEANTAASGGGGGMSYSNSSGAEETSDDGGGGRASNLGAAAAVVELKFPRLAKFVDTVTPPNFNTMLKDGRMYEEEVPKAKVSTIDKIPDIYQLCSCCMNTLCVYFLGELMLMMMMMMMMMHVSYFWHMIYSTIYPDCSHAIETQFYALSAYFRGRLLSAVGMRCAVILFDRWKTPHISVFISSRKRY